VALGEETAVFHHQHLELRSIRPLWRGWFVRSSISVTYLNSFPLSDEELAVLRTGCFKYFERGGDCVEGPVSLLSG
jgi:hypothetical protein